MAARSSAEIASFKADSEFSDCGSESIIDLALVTLDLVYDLEVRFISAFLCCERCDFALGMSFPD